MSVNTLTADPDFDSVIQPGDFEVTKNFTKSYIFVT